MLSALLFVLENKRMDRLRSMKPTNFNSQPHSARYVTGTTLQELFFFFTVIPFYKYYDSKLLLSTNLLLKLTIELTVGFLHVSPLLLQDAFNSESHLY